MKSKQPRRLKWSNLGYTPRGNIRLLDSHFMDRWGNMFRWTPRWDEVWLMFLEAMRTELSNNPDGAWAELFRDLASIAIVRSKEGHQLPKYPELIEELMNTVYLGAYVEETFPDAKVLKKVSLGPTRLHFGKIRKEKRK